MKKAPLYNHTNATAARPALLFPVFVYMAVQAVKPMFAMMTPVQVMKSWGRRRMRCVSQRPNIAIQKVNEVRPALIPV